MSVVPLAPMDRETFKIFLSDRRKRGRTLLSIAEEFGVSQYNVFGWISGRRKPSMAVLMLASYLVRNPEDIGSGLPRIEEVREP